MKPVYLLDTNIVSEFSKERPNPQVVAMYARRKELCAISAITWQELTRGVTRLPDGRKKQYLAACLESYLNLLPIIPYDAFAARICGEMQAQMEKHGKPLPYYDSQIAATVIANGMVLVTHNLADFAPAAESAFLRVEDWFGAA